ncbi:MAG: patatin-like phospholipase family protein [Gammaproteobacteria bacterium]
MKRKFHFAIFALLGLLSGCGSFSKNPPLTEFNSREGYRFEALEPGPENTDSLFVILAFSGGGTRAAALSVGVLESLRDIPIEWEGRSKRLLDEVDLISSVSGGSFTAAYYTLNRDGIFDGTFDRVFLKKDIEKELFHEALSPSNWPNLAGSSFGRSDLAAEYYDENIFAGATFQNLIAKGTRPFLMINGTDMTTGAQFPLIQDQFDLICSDIAQLSIGRAVATSSAFPGLLTPLTYENHAGECGYREPPWVELALSERRGHSERLIKAEQRRGYYQVDQWNPRRDYIHLVDGGVADNIGLRNILNALQTTDPDYSIQRMITQKKIKKLLVIVVDAATNLESSRDQDADVPDVIDVLTSAATIPLDNYSLATVKTTQSALNNYNEDVAVRQACEQILKSLCPGQALPGGELAQLEIYLSHISFQSIEDPVRRHKFLNLPTTFALPEEDVDALKDIARSLLLNDADFKRLQADLR